ncbi:MAG: FKBP-type peptidyl-prolyl cis-trans isomerase [Microbacteriaceae bacterium]|nr:FKBP-type peptidyl-prolyl cis-trans isomerase [Microbacteriaceae bacterium]
MKRTLAFAAATALVFGLAACSGSQGSGANENGKASSECQKKSGDLSNSIKVKGEAGKEDFTLDVQTPLGKAEKPQITLLKQGEGEKIEVAKDVRYAATVTVFNGKDGKKIDTQKLKISAAAEETKREQDLSWVADAISCAGKTKSRTVAVLGAKDIWGEQAAASGSIPGVGKDDTMVLIFDIGDKVAKPLAKAEGEEVKLPEGFPEVKVAETGEPTITIPQGAKAPTELKIANLIKGKGEEVTDGATVTVHYKGVIWSTGKEFDSSWKRGQPAEFPTSGVIEGFKKALVGQKVGSRVVALVDPKSGYKAEGLQQQGHKPDDVMVFVLDILSVQK